MTKISPLMRRGFALISRLILKRNFSDVLLDSESVFGGNNPWPLEVYSQKRLFFVVNHTSWWDPILAAELCINQQNLRAIGPMDEERLERQPFLKKVGIFGTKKGEAKEIDRFLQAEFNSHAETCMWVHVYGKFSPNERSVPSLKKGISHWSNNSHSIRVPIAIHYAFGPDKKPSVFIKTGDLIPTGALNPEDDVALMSDALDKEIKSLLEKIYDAHSGSKSNYGGFNSLLRKKERKSC
jgi:1-acyl-sn-glycerol-3-phosphate acyltransferase